MLLATGLVIVVVYLVLSINTYLETYAFGVFSLGYGRVGPTEARLALIALNTVMALGAGLSFDLFGIGMTPLDVVGLSLSALALLALGARASATSAPWPGWSPPRHRRPAPPPAAAR